MDPLLCTNCAGYFILISPQNHLIGYLLASSNRCVYYIRPKMRAHACTFRQTEENISYLHRSTVYRTFTICSDVRKACTKLSRCAIDMFHSNRCPPTYTSQLMRAHAFRCKTLTYIGRTVILTRPLAALIFPQSDRCVFACRTLPSRR